MENSYFRLLLTPRISIVLSTCLIFSHCQSQIAPRCFSSSGSSQDFCLQPLVAGSCSNVCKALPDVMASSLSFFTAATQNHFLFPKPFHAVPSAWNYPPPSLSDSFFKTQVQRPCLQKASPMVHPASSVGPLSQKSTPCMSHRTASTCAVSAGCLVCSSSAGSSLESRTEFHSSQYQCLAGVVSTNTSPQKQ